MISPLELQRLRDLSIEEVAQRLGFEVCRHKCLCPFHADKHPSLSFSTSRNTYRCWVCGASGGTIDLVMNHLHKDFREACEWLGASHDLHKGNSLSLTHPQREVTGSYQKGDGGKFEPARYARFFEHPWLSPEARHFLFEERMLDPRVISWCRVTSWQDREGVNWLQIPYYDLEGKLIGIQNRNLGPQAPRFKFPYGSHCSIYNLPVLHLLQPHEECWIAEGSSDCWSLLSDHHKAIAIPSATLLQPRDMELLQRVTAELSVRWKMAPDQDEPGRDLACKLKKVLPNLEIVELPEGCKDYSELYMRQRKQLVSPQLTK